MHTYEELHHKIVKLERRVHELEEKMRMIDVNTEEVVLMQELYKQAKEIVIRDQKASPIYLQRKLFIDLPRARHLMLRLEADGIIGPETGAQTREILVGK